MARMFRLPLVLLALLVASCAGVLNGPDRPPTRAEIIGTYDMGHAGFDEELELHQDGSYKRTLFAHLDSTDATYLGTWRLQGKYLFFEPVPAIPTISSLVQAEAFFYKHKPAFVRTQDLKKEKVHEWWVYQPRVR